MTVSLKLNETKRRMVYVSLKRTETDTVYIQHCIGLQTLRLYFQSELYNVHTVRC